MTIALIHYRLINFGGLETRLINYTRYLAKEGYDVTIICAKISPEISFPDNVKIVKINPGLMPKLFRFWLYNKKLKKEMEKRTFDLSISLGRTNHQDILIAPANHWGYIKAVGQTRLGIKDRLVIKMEENAFRESRVIFANSEMSKNEIIRYYNVDENKIKILFPPVNEKFNTKLKEDQNALKQKYGMDPKKYSLIFVSTSHERKGLKLLLKIFSSLQEDPFELVIAGLPAVRSTLANVKYLGYFDEMQELYAAADFTIHPAKYEPFGQIIPESIMSGTPVLISSYVGAKEIVGPNEGMVIDSFDPMVWISAIKSLADKKFEISQSFAKENNLTLEQHFSAIFNFKKT